MITNNMDCPCYRCTLRTPACHSACDSYIMWSDKRVRQRAQELQSPEHAIREYFILRNINKLDKYGK